MAISGYSFFSSTDLSARRCKACHQSLCTRSINPCAKELARILRVDAASLVLLTDTRADCRIRVDHDSFTSSPPCFCHRTCQSCFAPRATHVGTFAGHASQRLLMSSLSPNILVTDLIGSATGNARCTRMKCWTLLHHLEGLPSAMTESNSSLAAIKVQVLRLRKTHWETGALGYES